MGSGDRDFTHAVLVSGQTSQEVSASRLQDESIGPNIIPDGEVCPEVVFTTSPPPFTSAFAEEDKGIAFSGPTVPLPEGPLAAGDLERKEDIHSPHEPEGGDNV